jgi:hypothetical protein
LPALFFAGRNYILQKTSVPYRRRHLLLRFTRRQTSFATSAVGVLPGCGGSNTIFRGILLPLQSKKLPTSSVSRKIRDFEYSKKDLQGGLEPTVDSRSQQQANDFGWATRIRTWTECVKGT